MHVAEPSPKELAVERSARRAQSAGSRRARGPEAFRPASIAPYAMPGNEVSQLNKVTWPACAADAVLLVHDVQNHWVRMFQDPSSWLDRIATLRRCCDDAGIPCIYTTARRPRNPAERGLAQSLWGLGIASGHADATTAEIDDKLRPRPVDFVIDKPKYSAFYDTELEALLRRLGRRQLLLTGVFGHHGVMLTAADAYMRNIQVLLAADAMGDYSRAEHDMTLAYVAEVCGCVVTTQQVIADLAS
jgi:bifunctional isochorismate lyase / aryl carrier protein